MPYKVSKSKKGLRVKNKSTGKVRHFKNRKAFKRWSRIAEAIKHGWKPTRKRK